jgi:hypothetical protein
MTKIVHANIIDELEDAIRAAYGIEQDPRSGRWLQTAQTA